jgi:hypothetical protein
MNESQAKSVQLNEHQVADVRFIQNPGHWPKWQSLPMKHKDGRCGFLWDVQPLGKPIDRQHESLRTVIVLNPWDIFTEKDTAKRKAMWDKAERKTYESVEAMIADGWQAD